MDQAIIIDINPIKCVAGYSRTTLPILSFEPFVGKISQNCADPRIHEKYPSFIHPDDFGNYSAKANIDIIPVFTTSERGVESVNWEAYFFLVEHILHSLCPQASYPDAVDPNSFTEEKVFMKKLNSVRNSIYNKQFNLKPRSFDPLILFEYKSGNSRVPEPVSDQNLSFYDFASAKRQIGTPSGTDPVEILRGSFTSFQRDHPVIFVTFPCETENDSIKRLDLCFQLGLLKAQVIDRNTLISMSHERISSLVIETFDKFTTLTPVIDAYSLRKSVTIVPIGLDHHTKELAEKLKALEPDIFAKREEISDDALNFKIRHYLLSMLSSKEYFVLSDEIVHHDSRRQKNSHETLKQCENLPNFSPLYRNSFNLQEDHYRIPELLFCPRLMNFDCPDIIQSIVKTINKLEREEVRELLWTNILLAGANPFSSEKRLQNELSVAEVIYKVKVSALSTLSLKFLGQFDVAFLGGSIIEAAQIFDKLWISAEEWTSAENDEIKLDILAERSF